ncbi:uncharacterized protein LOC111055214 [Nilaparvata lugens]|uniref:uncharacterized protein LOC111055214 n=1 Tax=Nilaparvata lugens TaxID=108931 RepID=UPI00193C9C66|nr:uncharacterized protein LOC111055214 [Nilaparvata lugens]
MKTGNGTRVDIKYYLQHWYQEVWECTRATEPDTADKMYRIVNGYSMDSDKLYSVDVLYNYDGVTIYRTKPNESSPRENVRGNMIIFVKEIKYIHKESVVKFEGVLKLTRPNHSGTGDVTELALPHSPHRSRKSYRRDILLPKINVVFQTVVVNPQPKLVGSRRIYEFGENTQGEIKQGELPYMQCRFKLDTVKKFGEAEINWKLMTKASLYRTVKEGGPTERVAYDNKNQNTVRFFSLESIKQRIWNCEREINGIKYNYKRVQNEFRIDFEASGNKGNALIYHYEGVTVTRDGVVREVKYYNAESKSIRYDGVVWLIEPTGEEATGLVGSILDKLHLDDKSGREVYYYLDKPMLQFRSVNGEGRLVQFGKPAESDRLMKVVEPTPGKPVTCTTYSDYLEDSRFPTATELFTTFQSEQQQTNFASWIKIIPGKEETRAYTYKNSRSIWECKREQDKQLFLRVENIYVPSYILYPMDKLFVADGLSLKTILLPDKSDNFLITEVKYFEQKRNAENELTSLVPVKYDGEVILVVEKPSTIMKRLYPSTSDYELAGSDTNGKYWSIDALKTQLRKIKQVLPIEEILKEDATVKKGRRTYKNGAAYRRSLGAAENTKSPPKTSRRNSMVRSVAAVTKGVANAVTGSKTETGKKELPGVIYIKKGKVYAIALGGRGRRIFHIAADDWTEKADENGYLCIQDIWSPKDRLRFIPKVIERIDDYNYELNGEALSKLFKVEQEVHFCAAKYKFAKARVLTRVTTTLEADANGINAVSYSGSSRVDTFEQQDGKNNAKRTVIKVTIDTFIEENSSAIYKSDTPISQYETKLSQNVLSRLASIINPK